MKFLLDTCCFIWVAEESSELSAAAREAMRDPRNELYLSTVSAWDVSRKYAQGSLKLTIRPEKLIAKIRSEVGIEELPLCEEAAITAEKFPFFHRDPFDRMLIAQAMLNGMSILTSDPAFAAYPVRVLW